MEERIFPNSKAMSYPYFVKVRDGFDAAIALLQQGKGLYDETEVQDLTP